MKQNKTRMIAVSGLLVAVSVCLQYIEVPVFFMPSFIKLDFSDLPALIGAFMYGPIAGVIISALKNLIHMPMSSSAFIGELSNFILSATFSAVAGIIYMKNKTKKNAIIASIVGSITMAVISLPVNYFIIYPMYYSVLHFPEVAVLSMYQALLPSIKNMIQALIVFNVPFTLMKGFINACICIVIYKRLSILLKGDLTNK